LDSVFCLFQAEDCIRDFHVTGVQTCALPISAPEPALEPVRVSGSALRIPESSGQASYRRQKQERRGRRWSGLGSRHGPSGVRRRSEERRVGKECSAWWSSSLQGERLYSST